MEIDWVSLVLQGINFLILVWLLQRFLYRPVLNILDRRQAVIGERFEQADQAKAQAAGAKAAAEQAEAEIVAQRMQRLADVEAEAEALRAERQRQIEVEAAQQLAGAQAQLERERRDAEAGLRASAAELATEFARRVLARMPADALLHAYLDELAAAPVTQAPTGAQAGVTVVSAAELSQAERDEVIARLAPRLGEVAAWNFETDPALVAGLELHVGDTVISHTLAQDLARLRDAAADVDAV